jgi:hypothetical protein
MHRLPVEQGGASKDTVRRLTTSHQLRVLDMGTGTVTLLAEWEGSEWISLIGFSPDGERILFSRTGDAGAGPSSLWSINADGSDPGVLLPGPLMAIGSRPFRLPRRSDDGSRKAVDRHALGLPGLGQVVAVACALGNGR